MTLSTKANVMVIRRFCLEDDEKRVFWVIRFHVGKNSWSCTTSIGIVLIKVRLMVNDVLYIYGDHNRFYKGSRIQFILETLDGHRISWRNVCLVLWVDIAFKNDFWIILLSKTVISHTSVVRFIRHLF